MTKGFYDLPGIDRLMALSARFPRFPRLCDFCLDVPLTTLTGEMVMEESCGSHSINSFSRPPKQATVSDRQIQRFITAYRSAGRLKKGIVNKMNGLSGETRPFPALVHVSSRLHGPISRQSLRPPQKPVWRVVCIVLIKRGMSVASPPAFG